MNLDKIVRSTFVKTINKLDISGDIKSAAQTHETKEKFITNLKTQINNARKQRLAVGKKPFKDSSFIWWVEQMTGFYVGTVQQYFEQRSKSDAEKTRVKREADEKADIDATIAGKPQGDYADILTAVGDGDAVSKVTLTDSE
jgi:hypothetical protein